MDPEGVERKLAAILSADAVGYSRLMAEDEAGTIRTITAHREAIGSLVQQHHGRVVDSPGDNLLAEFPNALDAVQCAVEIQGVLRVRNQSLPEDRRMLFRIGVHLGDITREGDRVYGDGINIAARLEGLADPGGVCISRTVREQVQHKLELAYDDLGEQQVKNIPEPVRAYRVRVEPAVSVPKVKATPTRRAAWGVTVVLVIAAGALALWGVYLRPRPEAGTATPMETVALELPDKPSIAVLPFANMSGDPEQEYFSDGISEDLITDLSRISGLFVIARNSSFVYKGRPVNVEQVGRELRVRYVLEGSVRKANDRVRITAQLVDATTGGHVWADRYDRKLEDIFALQDEVTRKIVDALEVSLTKSEREGVQRVYTENLEAYDYYLLGRHYLGQWQLGAIEQAIQYLRRAVEADPSYARGYAGLAYAYSALGVFGGAHPADAWPYARAAAEKALALDEGLAEAHTALALEAMSHRYDWHAAREGFERALELDPSSVEALVWYGLLEGGIWGEYDRAMELLAQAERLDPRSPGVRFNIGWVVLWAEGYAEAEAAFDSLVTSEPEYFGGHEGLAFALVGQGRYEEALAAARTTLAVGDPDYDLAIGYLGYLYGRLGRTADAVRQLERLDELAAGGRYVSPVARAYVHAGLDEVDEAFAWLEKGYQERTHWLIWLQRESYFWGNLASDPRFQELLRRIGFPES